MTAGIRARLEELEGSELDPRSSELQVVLCWLVQGDIPIDDGELNAARRRAMFVLAAGGDPHRDVGTDSIAAERLADELDTPGRRAQLAAALDELPAEDLPAVTAAVESLRADPELAWRSFALSLLADELADGVVRERELTVAGLAATLTLPEGDVRGGVVPLHPASDGSRRQFLFEHLVETLVPRGVAVLRFDRRPSPAGDVPFEAQADDALEALRELRALPEVGSAPSACGRGAREHGRPLLPRRAPGGGVSDPARRLWSEPGRADALRDGRAAAPERL